MILLVAPLSGRAFAQTKADTLWATWQNTSLHDSLRLKAIGDFAWGKMGSRPDSAYFFAQLQYDYAKQVGNNMKMAEALDAQAMSFLRRGNFQEAINYYERSLKLWEHLGNPENIGHAISNLAGAYANHGNYPTALKLFYQTLHLWDKAGSLRYKALTLERMGNICMTIGNYPVAVEYFTQALTAQESNGDKDGIARSFNSLGTVNSYLKDYKNAIHYYTESLKIKEDAGQMVGAAKTLCNIGMIHYRQKDYDKAQENYVRSIAMLKKAGDQEGVAVALNNLGMLYQAKEEYLNAFDNYQRSMEIYEGLANRKGITNVLFNLSETLDKMGRKAEARTMAERALEMARSMGLVSEMKNTGKALYALYKESGQTAKALEMYELYVTMRDSLLNEENQKEVMRRQFQYEYDKKETLMAAEQEKKDLLSKEEMRRKDLQRNAFIGGFTLMLLLAGVFFKQRNRISQEKARSEELLLNILPEETAAELKEHGKARSRLVPEAIVLFTDFQGFTAMSERLGPRELVEVIDRYFRAFDRIIKAHGLEKIKTIGDAYMAAGGLPVRSITHPKDAIAAALDIRDATDEIGKELEAQGIAPFRIRIGIHAGPVIAGVVGEHKFQYDIWGDTVNTASRMESSGAVGKVNISADTYELVKDYFACEYRGEIEAKGKGKIGMYFVEPLT